MFFGQCRPATLTVAGQPLKDSSLWDIKNTRHECDGLFPHDYGFDDFFALLASFFCSLHAAILTCCMRELMGRLIHPLLVFRVLHFGFESAKKEKLKTDH